MKIIDFLNVLVKSNCVIPSPFGSVSCFVVEVCLSNYNLNSFLIHQASYSKGYQWSLIHREVLESIGKIGRYPTKVSEVLCNYVFLSFKYYTDKLQSFCVQQNRIKCPAKVWMKQWMSRLVFHSWYGCNKIISVVDSLFPVCSHRVCVFFLFLFWVLFVM